MEFPLVELNYMYISYIYKLYPSHQLLTINNIVNRTTLKIKTISQYYKNNFEFV